MKTFLTLIILIITLFFSACAVKDYQRFDKNQDVNRTITSVSDADYEKDKLFEWKIAKGDRVMIHVYSQASGANAGQLSDLLSRSGTESDGQGLLIDNKGTVQLPFIGPLRIMGLTENQAAEKITQEYKKYLKNPFVVVQLTNQKLFVLGEVKAPGVVPVTHGTISIFEALALTGDITDFADRTKIKIIRGSMRNPEIHEVDLTDFNKLKSASLILQPNDILYVASRDSKAKNAGYAEELPFWQLLSTIITPISQAAILYGVFNQ